MSASLAQIQRCESDGVAKVRDYEKQIDQLVYKLYGLEKEEIRTIEEKRSKFYPQGATIDCIKMPEMPIK